MIEQKLLSVVDFLWGKQRNETIHFFLLTWREAVVELIIEKEKGIHWLFNSKSKLPRPN